jgi:hypothetical protein
LARVLSIIQNRPCRRQVDAKKRPGCIVWAAVLSGKQEHAVGTPRKGPMWKQGQETPKAHPAVLLLPEVVAEGGALPLGEVLHAARHVGISRQAHLLRQHPQRYLCCLTHSLVLLLLCSVVRVISVRINSQNDALFSDHSMSLPYAIKLTK